MANTIQVSSQRLSWDEDDNFRIIPNVTVLEEATRPSLLWGPDGTRLECRPHRDPIGYIWPQEKS